MTTTQPTHVVTLRAVAAEQDGPHAQVKVAHTGEPSDEALAAYREAVVSLYEASFDSLPDRIGVAVLPYVEELDDLAEDAHWRVSPGNSREDDAE